MKLFTIIFAVSIFIGFSSCSLNECEERLINEQPSQHEFILEKFENAKIVDCSFEQHAQYTFEGLQKPNGKCSFFEVSLKVGPVSISTFNIKFGKVNHVDLIIYEFESDEDLMKMKEFIPDLSYRYEMNNEDHQFHEAEDRIYLYYFGAP